MKKLSKKFDDFARKHKLFWFHEENWNFLNSCSWDNRIRVKYLNHLNSKDPLYKIGDKILSIAGCCK